MVPEIITAESWEIVKPKIIDFTARPLYTSAVRKIRLQQLKNHVSLPTAISQKIEKENQRLNKTCGHFAPYMSHTVIPKYYPYAPRFITYAEQQLKSSDYALQYAEHRGMDAEDTEATKAYFDCLSGLLVKDSSGFELVEWVAYDLDHTNVRQEIFGSNYINEIIKYGAERYKFIYNTIVK